MSGSDEFFMRGAFALAQRALGQTWPNPAVGAVVVQPGDSSEVISRGWTMPGGRPHAEHIALEKAGSRAKGATLFVTLEPCAHHGKTPPCADTIIAAGIKRVVCSVKDPDPRVAGAGFAKLRDAGIEVVESVLAEEGARIAQGHILRTVQARPIVQLKLAVGSDGLIPKGEGKPIWVTGEEARAHGHLLRARADAILVGRGTVEADNPSLTCRLPGLEDRSPVRVVLDSNLKLCGATYQVLDTKAVPTWLVCVENADQAKADSLKEAGLEVVRALPGKMGGLDPLSILNKLAERGITRLLIEGGPRVAGSFWRAGLVDEIYLYRGSKTAGAYGLKALSQAGLEDIPDSPEFAITGTRTFGADTLEIYRRIRA